MGGVQWSLADGRVQWSQAAGPVQLRGGQWLIMAGWFSEYMDVRDAWVTGCRLVVGGWFWSGRVDRAGERAGGGHTGTCLRVIVVVLGDS